MARKKAVEEVNVEVLKEFKKDLPQKEQNEFSQLEKIYRGIFWKIFKTLKNQDWTIDGIELDGVGIVQMGEKSFKITALSNVPVVENENGQFDNMQYMIELTSEGELTLTNKPVTGFIESDIGNYLAETVGNYNSRISEKKKFGKIVRFQAKEIMPAMVDFL